MVEISDYERWRRFFPYSVWSSKIIDYWNEAVRVKSRIRFATAERAKELEVEFRDEVERIRTDLLTMCDAIRRTDWIAIPIDPEFIKQAESRTWLEYYMAEDIDFEIACINTEAVLTDCIEELEAKIVEWVDFIYTLTFDYTFGGKRRVVEFELKSGVENSEEAKEKMMELVKTYDEVTEEINKETIPAKIIEKAEYEFIFDHPAAFTSRFEYKETKKKPTSEEIFAKLFDHDASFTVADARGKFEPPEWYDLSLDDIMEGLYIRVFRRRVRKIR